MLLDSRALKIYIDGSALDNPGGCGGSAAVLEYPSDSGRENEVLLSDGYRETNNQRMELHACLGALRHVCEHGTELGVQRVLIVTDSKYIYEGWSRSLFWKANGWRNVAGRPIENSDLWKVFLSTRRRIRVRTEIVWRKGKTTPILRLVDRHAKDAAGQPWKVDRGFREGKIGRSKLGRGKASTLFPASGQQSTVRIYRSGIVQKNEHKIYFELYSEVENRLTGKYRAYAPPDIAVSLHRGHWYNIQFNSNLDYPTIQAAVEETPPSALENLPIS